MEELFELLNSDGSRTGVLKPRSEVHRDGDLHGASHMWIYRMNEGKAEILLQKRSADKDSFPGMYDISSAGHLDPGETFLAGAKRELKEELGIEAEEAAFCLLAMQEIEHKNQFYGQIFHNHELYAVYLLELPFDKCDITFQENEISSVIWIEAETLNRLIADDALEHCIWKEEWECVYQAVLKRVRLEQQMVFLLEADKEKEIKRQTYKTSLIKENDAEHAWHLALMVMLLAEHANEPIDAYRTMQMVLIHDLVEIDAGDTYAYDEKASLSQAERENKAADRIFGLLPEDQAVKLRAIWDEFEEWKTPEARFAHSLDNLQPLMLNDATNGRSWREHGIRKEQPMKRNARTAEGSAAIWNHVYQIICEHKEKGNLR